MDELRNTKVSHEPILRAIAYDGHPVGDALDLGNLVGGEEDGLPRAGSSRNNSTNATCISGSRPLLG